MIEDINNIIFTYLYKDNIYNQKQYDSIVQLPIIKNKYKFDHFLLNYGTMTKTEISNLYMFNIEICFFEDKHKFWHFFLKIVDDTFRKDELADILYDEPTRSRLENIIGSTKTIELNKIIKDIKTIGFKNILYEDTKMFEFTKIINDLQRANFRTVFQDTIISDTKNITYNNTFYNIDFKLYLNIIKYINLDPPNIKYSKLYFEHIINRQILPILLSYNIKYQFEPDLCNFVINKYIQEYIHNNATEISVSEFLSSKYNIFKTFSRNPLALIRDLNFASYGDIKDYNDKRSIIIYIYKNFKGNIKTFLCTSIIKNAETYYIKYEERAIDTRPSSSGYETKKFFVGNLKHNIDNINDYLNSCEFIFNRKLEPIEYYFKKSVLKERTLRKMAREYRIYLQED